MIIMMLVSSVAMGGFMLWQQFSASKATEKPPAVTDAGPLESTYGNGAPVGESNSMGYAPQNGMGQMQSAGMETIGAVGSRYNDAYVAPSAPTTSSGTDLKTLQSNFQVAYDNLMQAIRAGDQARVPELQRRFDEANRAINEAKKYRR